MKNPTISGNTVTITWQGKTAPHFISDLHQWENNPRPLAETSPGRWQISFDLPDNAYLEYAFFDPQTKTRYPDPLNPKSLYNGVGGHNHYFYMPGATATPYTRLGPGGLRGKISRHKIEARGVTTSAERSVTLYHPPTDAPAPLLVVYDGLDYFRRGRLAEIVDNLIAAQKIRPITIAFLQNAGQAGRMVEYGCSEPTLGLLTHPVLSLAKEQLNLLDVEKHPGAFGVMGSSMGGLMSLYTALRLPHIFGRALCQAGAYDIWGQETITYGMVKHFQKPEVRLWLDCGAMDFLLESNRKMASQLRKRGYTFHYQENGGAHNQTTWRNAAVDGLQYLFGV